MSTSPRIFADVSTADLNDWWDKYGGETLLGSALYAEIRFRAVTTPPPHYPFCHRCKQPTAACACPGRDK